jgi:hypothetical protein
LVTWWECILASVALVVFMMLLFELIVALRAPIFSPELIDISH